MELSRLFNPRGIALVGATERQGRIGRILFEGLMRSQRRLYPVHPEEAHILGHSVTHRITDLPEDVDLAIIATGAARAVDAAEACAAHGIPMIIVIAGGFGETGVEGEALEERLRRIPKAHGSRVLGPNSLGVFIPAERLDTIFVEHGDKALAGGGGVAFVTQSGSVGVEALGLASNLGYGMRAFVGLGNKSDLNELDFLNYFARDPETTCLAFYLESIENGREFLNAAQKAACTKPVLVLKAGRTAAGAHAVSSHTGRLAGSDQVVSGGFRQFGIQRAMDDEELCDASKALAMLPAARGNRIAVLTPAGGFGVMCADYIDAPQRGVNLQMAELESRTVRHIRERTLPFASCSNPVDLTASATDDMFGDSLDALMEDPGADIIICTAFFAPPGVTDRLIDVVAVRARQTEKPIIVFTQYGPYTELYIRRFYDAGVVGFPSIYRSVRAARFLVERSAILEAMGTQACSSTFLNG